MLPGEERWDLLLLLPSRSCDLGSIGVWVLC